MSARARIRTEAKRIQWRRFDFAPSPAHSGMHARFSPQGYVELAVSGEGTGNLVIAEFSTVSASRYNLCPTVQHGCGVRCGDHHLFCKADIALPCTALVIYIYIYIFESSNTGRMKIQILLPSVTKHRGGIPLIGLIQQEHRQFVCNSATHGNYCQVHFVLILRRKLPALVPGLFRKRYSWVILISTPPLYNDRSTSKFGNSPNQASYHGEPTRDLIIIS